MGFISILHFLSRMSRSPIHEDSLAWIIETFAVIYPEQDFGLNLIGFSADQSYPTILNDTNELQTA